jgi:hypothetical protein
VNYEVIFDTREVNYIGWGLAATALIVILTGIVVVVARRQFDGRAGAVFTYLFVGLVGLWTVVAWVSTVREYSSAIAALNDGRASVVQGRVSSYEPLPANRKGVERFCVEGKCFYYSDSDNTAGFSTTSSHGGPIALNLPVRVSFVGNTIVKLEVAK